MWVYAPLRPFMREFSDLCGVSSINADLKGFMRV